MSDSVRPHWRQPTRLPRPWDSPGKNTGVGCHFLLQCMKARSESEVAQSCLTLSDPMACSLPGSSAHGILQARVLEWEMFFIKLNSFLHLPFHFLKEWPWKTVSLPLESSLNSFVFRTLSQCFLSVFSLLVVYLHFFLQSSCITFALREGLWEEHMGVLGSKYSFFSLCYIPMLSTWVLCSFVLFFYPVILPTSHINSTCFIHSLGFSF